MNLLLYIEMSISRAIGPLNLPSCSSQRLVFTVMIMCSLKLRSDTFAARFDSQEKEKYCAVIQPFETFFHFLYRVLHRKSRIPKYYSSKRVDGMI